MSKPVGTIGSVPADSAEAAEAEEQPLLSRGLANSHSSHTPAGNHDDFDILQDLSSMPCMTIQTLAWENPPFAVLINARAKQ